MAFVCGLFIGGLIGYFVCALMVFSREQDEQAEREIRNNGRNDEQ